MKDTINTVQIENAINTLISMVDSELEKHEPRAYDDLVDAISDKLGDKIYASDAGSLMNLVYDLSEPSYKKRSLRLSGALTRASDEAVSQVESLADISSRLCEYIERGSKNTNLIKAEAHQLRHYAEEVQREVSEELSERVQGYRRDIEKINKLISEVKESQEAA